MNSMTRTSEFNPAKASLSLISQGLNGGALFQIATLAFFRWNSFVWHKLWVPDHARRRAEKFTGGREFLREPSF